jgi:hypothetical protein
MVWPDWFSSPLDTVRTVASFVLVFVVAGISNSLISANVRKLAQEKKWDNFFLHGWAHVTGDWETIKRRWWLWILLGAAGGLAGFLWLVAIFPPAPLHDLPSAEEITKTTAPIRAQLDQALKQISALQSQLEDAVNDRDAARQILPPPSFAPVLAVSPNESKSRIFTNKKVLDFVPTLAGITDLQAQILSSDEKGKWMNVNGVVSNVAPNMVLTMAPDEGGQIRCVFSQKWASKLAMIRQGDKLKVDGKIREYFSGDLTLEECEVL